MISLDYSQFVIPPAAAVEWLALDAALDGVVTGCQSSAEPEAWWDPAGSDDAKAVCRGCPVRSECLAYALAARERAGVWGGLTPDERAEQLRGAA